MINSCEGIARRAVCCGSFLQRGPRVLQTELELVYECIDIELGTI